MRDSGIKGILWSRYCNFLLERIESEEPELRQNIKDGKSKWEEVERNLLRDIPRTAVDAISEIFVVASYRERSVFFHQPLCLKAITLQ